MNGIHISAGGTVSCVGPEAVNIVRAATLKSAIGLYRKTGMKVNRAYTPTNMLAAAGQITGHTFKRGQAGLEQAEQALALWITEAKVKVAHTDARVFPPIVQAPGN